MATNQLAFLSPELPILPPPSYTHPKIGAGLSDFVLIGAGLSGFDHPITQ
jgi:hypothetical protein